ncbi:MAG: hypothetical protein ABIU11_03015 [Chitinophagaceae bacterium]
MPEEFIAQLALSKLNMVISFVLGFLLFYPMPAFCQQTTIIDTTTDPNHPIVIAGKQYDRSGLHNKFWGGRITARSGQHPLK